MNPGMLIINASFGAEDKPVMIYGATSGANHLNVFF